MSKSKQKGSAFERLIAKLIIETFNKRGFQFTPEDCYRTPSSGGHVYASKQNPSDLVLSDRLLYYLPFTFEAKRDESFDLAHFFVPEEKRQKSWREFQALAQVMKANESFKEERHPIVVFQKNRSEIFCIIPEQTMYEFVNTPDQVMHFRYDGRDWSLCLFKPLLDELADKAKEA